MGLKPKKYSYKNIFKNRSYYVYCRSRLVFGNIGLKILKMLYWNSTQFFRFKLFLKKLIRKAEKTKRKLWLKTFPFLPLSKKPQGLRMGKGKGKASLWYSKLRSGSILIESKNTRPGRSLFFFKQVTFKIPQPTKPILSQCFKYKINYS